MSASADADEEGGFTSVGSLLAIKRPPAPNVFFWRASAP
jgi:hypothetical protein